jgi:hypothetical protein
MVERLQIEGATVPYKNRDHKRAVDGITYRLRCGLVPIQLREAAVRKLALDEPDM